MIRAEILAMKQNMATKADLTELKMATKADLAELKVDMLKWMLPFFITIIGLLISSLFK